MDQLPTLSRWDRFNAGWDKYTSPPYLKYIALAGAGVSTIWSAFIASYINKYGLSPLEWGAVQASDLVSRVALLKAGMSFTSRFVAINYIKRVANSPVVEKTAHNVKVRLERIVDSERFSQYTRGVERLLERNNLGNKSAALFIAGAAVAYKGLEYALLHAVGAERPGQVLAVSVGLSLAASGVAARSARDERNLPTQVRDGCVKLQERLLEYGSRIKTMPGAVMEIEQIETVERKE